MISMIIAIAGPSGAGKSTLGKCSQKSSAFFIGYRCNVSRIALSSSRRNDPEDAEAVSQDAHKAEIELKGKVDLRVYLNGDDVSDEIRTLEIDQAAQ